MSLIGGFDLVYLNFQSRNRGYGCRE